MRSVFLRGAEAPRNPRIYARRIRRAEAGIRPGEVVAVRTDDGRFVGRAFWSPDSQIGARILDRDEFGPPVDGAWFERRIADALRLRREVLALEAVTDAYRVAHAEGDGLPALVIDRYADLAVIEVGARGTFEWLEEIEQAVRRVVGVSRVVVTADATAERIEGFRALDRHGAPAETIVRERDLRFHVDAREGHKTGFFCDQREARALVGTLARGLRVLDCCCYTGGFTLAAKRGGARTAHGVDLDEKAIAMAARNAKLNGIDASFEHADAFDVLRSKPEADLIVLDPPKLASTQKALPVARRKSVDLNALALAALPGGGLLFTFSCTGLWSPDDFLGHVREATMRTGRGVRLLRQTGQPPDHPVALDCPEGRYLTGYLLQAE